MALIEFQHVAMYESVKSNDFKKSKPNRTGNPNCKEKLDRQT